MKFSDIFKKGFGLPDPTDIIEGGLCIDISGERAYSKNESGVVFKIGLNEEDVGDILDTYNGFTPIGGIIMYAGQIADIPSNWVICDATDNGAPNLVDKFIYGTNDQSSIRATGGSADAIVVSHNHSTIAHDHTLTFSAVPDHTHTIPAMIASPHNGSYGNYGASLQSGTTTTQGGGGHTPSATMGTSNPNTNNTGVTGVNANLPPYVKLAYIMRKS